MHVIHDRLQWLDQTVLAHPPASTLLPVPAEDADRNNSDAVFQQIQNLSTHVVQNTTMPITGMAPNSENAMPQGGKRNQKLIVSGNSDIRQ